jgi:hypothetical protein
MSKHGEADVDQGQGLIENLSGDVWESETGS